MARISITDKRRALRLQNILLLYAHTQYQKSKGTMDESSQRKNLIESIETYKNFISEYNL